jgi:hypothetical protein
MPSKKSLSVVLLGTGFVLMALGGVVAPMLKEERLANQRAAALADLSDIGRVVDAILKRRPALAKNDAAQPLHYLFSEGKVPSNNIYATGPGAPLRDWCLATGTPDLGPDPWGFAYLVGLRGENGATTHIAILSAGPNGQINTAPDAILPGGDDVLLILD